MIDEIYKSIKSFNNYEASNLGRIRNFKTYRVLKHTINKDGYHRVGLYEDGYESKFFVHVLVIEAFLGYSNLETNHIDGNKDNNCITNLEYNTRQQNVKHSFDKGLHKPLTGMNHGMAKLTDNDIRDIRLSKAKIATDARKYDVSWTTISLIKKGRTWKQIV